MSQNTAAVTRLFRIGSKILFAFFIAFLCLVAIMYAALLIARHCQAWPFVP